MIRVNQIKLSVKCDENDLNNKIKKIIKTSDFEIVSIVKKSIDARDKNNLMYIYSVDIKCKDEKTVLKKNINNNNVMSTKEDFYYFQYKISSRLSDGKCMSPIIIGAGPAGYFCALMLARGGYKPLVFERGKCVEERSRDVNLFWEGGSINPQSNVSFGEGGAGTFSDGKLNTGIKDKCGRIQAVISDFITFGAPKDIGYQSKPHIGTDELKKVLANMRAEILRLGGEIHFNSQFIGYEKKNNYLDVKIIRSDGIEATYATNSLVLAIGHSARDTFKSLNELSLPMESKSFAIGVRIEHPRTMINDSQYGSSEEAKTLPAADYKMTFRSEEGRSVYSFCMCPGGFVVNASSGEEQAVVNGMSNHNRDEDNSNSAIVVNVTPEDFIKEGFGSYGVLAGVEFQKKYEKLAYIEGKGSIPVQLFSDYMNNKTTDKLGDIKPNIKGNYTLANINNCLPVYVNNAIIEGILYYDTKLKGFSRNDAVLSGIESRTSSPVRIVRNEDFMSQVEGIFPCGEGAGYAGGITSAAVDGIKVAEAVAKYINNL